MKKKIIALILAALAVVMCFSFAACKNDNASDGNAADADKETTVADNAASDLAYIKEKGKLVIGYTEIPLLNYNDENGNFVGFETDFAKAVCAELGVEAEFQLISWAAKETELASKNIDCIWNGMTITPERAEAMSISTPYMANKQVLIVKAEDADKYLKAEDMDGVAVVAEQGSAGEEVITAEDFFAKANFTAVSYQTDALREVKAGTADACVIDYIAAKGAIGEGTDYEDLVIVDAVSFADEEYGIAFRKGSDVTAEVNAIITKLVENGKLAEIGEEYKIAEQIIAK